MDMCGFVMHTFLHPFVRCAIDWLFLTQRHTEWLPAFFASLFIFSQCQKIRGNMISITPCVLQNIFYNGVFFLSIFIFLNYCFTFKSHFLSFYCHVLCYKVNRLDSDGIRCYSLLLHSFHTSMVPIARIETQWRYSIWMKYRFPVLRTDMKSNYYFSSTKYPLCHYFLYFKKCDIFTINRTRIPHRNKVRM